eukprot:c44532_g1_i1 orf=3-158(+)
MCRGIIRRTNLHERHVRRAQELFQPRKRIQTINLTPVPKSQPDFNRRTSRR